MFVTTKQCKHRLLSLKNKIERLSQLRACHLSFEILKKLFLIKKMLIKKLLPWPIWFVGKLTLWPGKVSNKPWCYKGGLMEHVNYSNWPNTTHPPSRLKVQRVTGASYTSFYTVLFQFPKGASTSLVTGFWDQPKLAILRTSPVYLGLVYRTLWISTQSRYFLCPVWSFAEFS